MRALLACSLLAGVAAPASAQQSEAIRYSLFNPAPRDALRELSTDRPDKTESPYTVDAGHIQIELDLVTYTRDRSGGVRTETVGVAPMNLKLGLTDSTDVQFVVEPYVRQTVSGRLAGMKGRIDGFGDVTLRLKQNLFGNDSGKAALALMPFVKLPTSTGGLGNDRAEFGLIVPLALTLSPRVGLGVMTEIDLLEKAGGHGHAPSFVNSATVSFDLTDRLGLYTELFTERSTDRGSKWVVTGNVGLTFSLSPNVQLDTGANVGITHAADDLNIFVGLSRRF